VWAAYRTVPVTCVWFARLVFFLLIRKSTNDTSGIEMDFYCLRKSHSRPSPMVIRLALSFLKELSNLRSFNRMNSLITSKLDQGSDCLTPRISSPLVIRLALSFLKDLSNLRSFNRKNSLITSKLDQGSDCLTPRISYLRLET